MTQSEENLIRDRISSLISPQLIRRMARVQGVLKRRRKVNIVALVYSLVFGFAGAARRSIAGFRRAYGAATRTTLIPSAFYSRFTSSRTGYFQNALPEGNVGTLVTEQGTFSVTYNSDSVVLSNFTAR